MNDRDLRSSLIRLAHAKPELRAELLPLLAESKTPQSRTAASFFDFRGKSYETLNRQMKEAQADLNKKVEIADSVMRIKGLSVVKNETKVFFEKRDTGVVLKGQIMFVDMSQTISAREGENLIFDLLDLRAESEGNGTWVVDL